MVNRSCRASQVSVAKIFFLKFLSLTGRFNFYTFSWRNDAIKKKIERVFDVWSERNVYDHEFIVKLNETLYSKHAVILFKLYSII